MSKFKVGDRVVVVDYQSVGNYYKNGDKGIVSSAEHKFHGYVTREDGVEMNLLWTEIDFEEETEMALTSTMNAEQIRDEIIRIDARIEEAKKDIENAENERNSLVEKLREKGFELTHNDSENDIYEEMDFKIGDQVRVIGKTHGHYFSIGEIVKVTEVNPHDYQCTDSHGKYWWLNPAEIEKI